MTMFDPCRDLRDGWFEHEARRIAGSLPEHLAQCAACRDWSRRIGIQAELLASLPKIEAPDALRDAVYGELAFSELRIARAVSSLEQCPAPPALEARVAELLAEGGLAASSIEGLDRARAPTVLERLVDEELAHPQAHRAERFVGGLEPALAPSRLEGRLARWGGTRSSPRLRRLGAAAATLAAGLFLFLVLRDGRGPGGHERRLPLVPASGPEELDPLARGLALALGGFALEEPK